VLLVFDQDHRWLRAKRVCLRDRLITHAYSAQLDRDLAMGTPPEATEVLALRAQTLVRPNVRYGLARSLQELLDWAIEPFPSRNLRIPVCRDRVRDAREEFHLVIDRLRTPAPVPAQGVARATVLLSDGSGPLYHRGNGDDLRGMVRDAAKALHPLSAWQ
jgi:hypothetical protein